jgi:hypothetical protein
MGRSIDALSARSHWPGALGPSQSSIAYVCGIESTERAINKLALREKRALISEKGKKIVSGKDSIGRLLIKY